MLRRQLLLSIVGLLAWDWGGMSSEGYCLNEEPSSLQLIPYDGRSYQFPIAHGVWNSPQPVAHIINILMREYLGYNTTCCGTMLSSEQALREVAGCTDPSLGCTSQEKLMGAFRDPPAAWGIAEVWTTAVEEQRLMQYVDGVGAVGYIDTPGLYLHNRVSETARQQGIFLGFWESLKTPQAKSFLSTVSTLDTAIKSLTVWPDLGWAFGCSGDDCNMAGMIRPLCINGSVHFDEMASLGFPCEDGWYYSPGCSQDKDACIPVVLANYEWNVKEWAHVAKTLHLPFAITWLGWFGEVHAVSDLHARSFNFVFYWYRPDSTFLSLLPEMIFFKEEHLIIRQFQSTLKIVWPGLRDVAPDVYDLWAKFNLGNSDMDAMMLRIGVGVTPYTIACDWLRNPRNTNTWKMWVRDHTACRQGDGLIDSSGAFVTARSLAEGCAVCHEGNYSKPLKDHQGTTYVCEPCKAGSSQPKWGESACVSCELGTFQVVTGQSACETCGKGDYQSRLGSTSCYQCASSMTTLILGAHSEADCLCPQETYYVNGSSTPGVQDAGPAGECVLCGEEFSCLGDQRLLGDGAPYLRPTYMVHPPLPLGTSLPRALNTYKCRSAEVCPGTSNFWDVSAICANGLVGIACGSCPDGEHLYKSKECVQCETGASTGIVFAIVLAPLAALWAYVAINAENREDSGEPHDVESDATTISKLEENSDNVMRRCCLQTKPFLKEFRYDVYTVMRDNFGILLQFVQVVGLIGSRYLATTPPVVLSVTKIWKQVFDFDMFMSFLGLRVDCALGRGFLASYSFNLAFPVLIAATFFFNLTVYRLLVGPVQRRLRRVSARSLTRQLNLKGTWITLDKTMNAVGTQVQTLFVSITSISTTLFLTYPHPAGHGASLQRYPQVLKYSNEWYNALPLAVVGLGLYTVGVFVYWVWVCYRAPSMAHDTRFRCRNYFLISNFRAGAWWWCIVLLLRGLAINASFLFFEDPALTNHSLLFVFELSLVINIIFRPYPFASQNITETFCMLALCLIVPCVDRRTSGGTSHPAIAIAEQILATAPFVVTVLCMALPLHKFVFKRREAVALYRQTQRFRDVMVLSTLFTNHELNVFMKGLADHDRATLRHAMNTICTQMLRLQPTPHIWEQQLISDAGASTCATDHTLGLRLEHAFVKQGRTNHDSLSERALVQWFLQQLRKGYPARPGSCCDVEKGSCAAVSLWDLFVFLDSNNDGKVDRNEFVWQSIILAPHMTVDEATEVFEIVDIDESCALSWFEFAVVFEGMSFTSAEEKTAWHSLMKVVLHSSCRAEWADRMWRQATFPKKVQCIQKNWRQSSSASRGINAEHNVFDVVAKAYPLRVEL